MMGGCWQHLLVLWMMTVGAMDVLADYPDIGKPTDENPVRKSHLFFLVVNLTISGSFIIIIIINYSF